MPTARPDGVTTTSPRRGRPPRASREQIIDAAVALLREAPDDPLTMARVANAVGLTPMALYRHFKDRDELMDEVVGRILMERNAAIPREGPWQDQLRAWVLGGLDHLVPCAQVVQVVLAGGSARWVHDAATLVRILEQAGYEDDQLAEMQVWIALSVGGYVMAESSRRQGPNAPEVYAALAHLDPDDAERLAVLMPRIDRAFDQMHERFADRLIQTVEAAAPS
ncbi:MAG TPA: TetR/AcrR family transcriptional regulator [Acidimicrobiia bacterium]